MRSTPTASAHLKLVTLAPVSDIVAMARQTRKSAEAFRATVDRFGAEMPDCMDRFHEAMRAFRSAAADLRAGVPQHVGPTPLETVSLPQAA